MQGTADWAKLYVAQICYCEEIKTECGLPLATSKVYRNRDSSSSSNYSGRDEKLAASTSFVGPVVTLSVDRSKQSPMAWTDFRHIIVLCVIIKVFFHLLKEFVIIISAETPIAPRRKINGFVLVCS